MAWISIGIIVLLLICAIVGCKRGLLQSIINLCGTLVTLVLSILASKPANNLLESWFGMNTALGNSLHDWVAGYCTNDTLPFLMGKLASVLLGADYTTKYPDIGAEEFIKAFSNAIGTLIGIVITVIILYILIRVILYLLSKLFDSITENKAINKFDRAFGSLIGLVKGVVIVFGVMVVAYFVSGIIPSFGDTLTTLFETNSMAKTIYDWSVNLLNNTILPYVTSAI